MASSSNPKTKGKRKSTGEGLGSSEHSNICAFIDDSLPVSRHTEPYLEIIRFLKRCRISTAISALCPPYKKHIEDFWTHAFVEITEDPVSIKSKVLSRDIYITENIIRTVLDIKDKPEDPVLLDGFMVRGCFLRSHYDGDIKAKALIKGNLPIQFKYLAHVLLHCLGHRKGGFDDLRETMQSAFAALILNHPFNFSRMIFEFMRENLNGRGEQKFLMYPRFIQMIINTQQPDLPKDPENIMTLKHMTDATLNRQSTFRGRTTRPIPKRLFGGLVNPDYVPPPNDKWRHDNSDSEVEHLERVPSSGDDGDDDQGGDDPVGPSTTSAPVSTTEAGGSVGLRDEPSDSDNEQREYEIVQVGSRMVSRKRRASERVSDADFIPSIEAVQASSTPPPPKKKKGKVKHMAKRPKYQLVRRTASETDTTTATITTTEPSITISTPTSTTITTIATSTSTYTASITQTIPQTPIYTTASTTPPQTQTLPFMIPPSAIEQLTTLSSLVLQLIHQNQEQATQIQQQNTQITSLIEQNQNQAALIESLTKRLDDQNSQFLHTIGINARLASTVDSHTLRIKGLEDDRKKVWLEIDSLRDPTLRLTGPSTDGREVVEGGDGGGDDDGDESESDEDGDESDSGDDDGSGGDEKEEEDGSGDDKDDEGDVGKTVEG